MPVTGGPIYFPTSVASGAAGPRHVHSLFRGWHNISLSPLQRAGVVSAQAASLFPAFGGGGKSFGDPVYPAAWHDMTLPPIVPIAGSPRDPRFQV